MQKQLRRIRRMDIKIKTGPPFNIPELHKTGRDIFLNTQTDEIMCRIAALLPLSYRGFYTHHPRVKEILDSQKKFKDDEEGED